MPDSYLKRYLAGEYEQVWAELTALGSSVRQEPGYSDALAVGNETMERAAKNVQLLHGRLVELDYRFAFPDTSWVLPGDESLEQLDLIEEDSGPIPMSLHAWFETVGSVNFAGSHPLLSVYWGLDRDDLAYPSTYSDPLVVDGPDEGAIFAEEEPVQLWIAPDSVHKANHSGGSPTHIILPNPSADAPLVSDDWDGVLFVSYLRECFKWGGFPGLRYDKSTLRHDAAESLRLIDRLVEGLLPL